MSGAPITNLAEFRALRGRLRIGDTVHVEVERSTGAWRTAVVVAAYERPVVRTEEIPEATERQRALRARWVAGAP